MFQLFSEVGCRRSESTQLEGHPHSTPRYRRGAGPHRDLRGPPHSSR